MSLETDLTEATSAFANRADPAGDSLTAIERRLSRRSRRRAIAVAGIAAAVLLVVGIAGLVRRSAPAPAQKVVTLGPSHTGAAGARQDWAKSLVVEGRAGGLTADERPRTEPQR